MHRRGAKSLSVFHRFGITLVILGMMQSLAPTCFRPARSSLRVMGHLRIAFVSLLENDPATTTHLDLVWSGPLNSAASVQDQESDQESHDTEDLSETFAWPEAMTDHRSVQRASRTTLPGPLLEPERRAERTRASLQRMRAMPILAAYSANATAYLCRFTC